MLADVVPFLACPHCGRDLALTGGAMRCAAGHAFDVAREGYVSLLPGDARTRTADTPTMVAARDAFLASGRYAAIARAVAEVAERALPEDGEGCVVDAGAGTGYYLAHVLDRLPGRVGLALDISKAALRRAARAHERIGAAACDIWGPLPVRTGAAALLLDVFAPRNAAEFQRVLAPGGALVVVTPTPRHLEELVGALGLLTVDERKPERLAEQLGARFTPVAALDVVEEMQLAREEVATVVGMGPSAWHTDEDALATRIAELDEPARVTASVTVAAYRRA